MELILVRHGEPETVSGVIGGADPPLNSRGRAQAVALGESWALGRIDAIVQSPARRAVETAGPIAARLGLDPLTVPDLVEWDWGREDYTPVEELRAANDPRWQQLLRGEPYGDVDGPAFRRRVLTAVQQLVSSHPGRRRVLVVCHAGVINAYIGDVLGLKPLLWIDLEYTSFSRVAASRNGQRSVLSLNETPHLVPQALVSRVELLPSSAL